MPRTTGIRSLAGALLLLAFVAPLAAQGEVPEQGYKQRFEFFIGGFWPSTNTRIRLDARDGSAGTDISSASNPIVNAVLDTYLAILLLPLRIRFLWYRYRPTPYGCKVAALLCLRYPSLHDRKPANSPRGP